MNVDAGEDCRHEGNGNGCGAFGSSQGLLRSRRGRQQLEVARASIAESQESLRINQDRYEAGLLTVTDLLAAEEAARRTQADYWETLCRYYTGFAALELASGKLNPQSPVVTP